jgi:hypothetical protein
VDVRLVDGQSTLGLTGTTKSASFDNIDGQSVVEASRFVAESFLIRRINGQSVVLLHARTIVLPDMDGQCTIIAVVSRGGSIKAGNLNGKCRILWSKEDESDPDVNVNVGKLAGQSKVVQVRP